MFDAWARGETDELLHVLSGRRGEESICHLLYNVEKMVERVAGQEGIQVGDLWHNHRRQVRAVSQAQRLRSGGGTSSKANQIQTDVAM